MKVCGYAFLIAILNNIKIAFFILDKKVFLKKCKVFVLAGITGMKASQISITLFFFFYNGQYSEFIYIEMAGTTATNLKI